MLEARLSSGKRVGQVEPSNSSTQVKDLDLSSVNARILSRVGQVRPVVSSGHVKDLDPSG